MTKHVVIQFKNKKRQKCAICWVSEVILIILNSFPRVTSVDSGL